MRCAQIIGLAVLVFVIQMGCKKAATAPQPAPVTVIVQVTDTPVPGTPTYTATPTATPTNTSSPYPSFTPTETSSPTETPTITDTYTITNTRTPTFTRTHSPTITQTFTPTDTPTVTATFTPVGTEVACGQTFTNTSDLAISPGTSQLFFSSTSGYLRTVSVSGGSITDMAFGSDSNVETDGYNVFYYRSNYLCKIPVGGGVPITLYNGYRIALDASSVYCYSNYYLMKISKGGGTTVTLGNNGNFIPSDIEVVGTTLAFNRPASLYTGSTTTGAAVTAIVSGLNQSQELATDGTYIFVAEAGAGRIMRYDTTGFSQLVVTSALVSPTYLFYDAASSNIYYSDPGSNAIGKVSAAGGSVTTIRSSLNNPGPLVVDDSYVYWMDRSQGCIYRYPK